VSIAQKNGKYIPNFPETLRWAGKYLTQIDERGTSGEVKLGGSL
jgi:hypothetical protein